jgi:hypothetical protein
MQNLICLNGDQWPPLKAFLPAFTLNELPARGHTFCKEIHTSEYTTVLTDLVLECLYEQPRHRPSLKDIKERVFAVYETTVDLREQDDDFPEPMDFLKTRGSCR